MWNEKMMMNDLKEGRETVVWSKSEVVEGCE
jgi:hypothetical protein